MFSGGFGQRISPLQRLPGSCGFCSRSPLGIIRTKSMSRVTAGVLRDLPGVGKTYWEQELAVLRDESIHGLRQ